MHRIRVVRSPGAGGTRSKAIKLDLWMRVHLMHGAWCVVHTLADDGIEGKS